MPVLLSQAIRNYVSERKKADAFYTFRHVFIIKLFVDIYLMFS